MPFGSLLGGALAHRIGITDTFIIGGAACLAGIGFTMSLFIGGLAFGAPGFQNMVRIGVIAGSIASALLGVLVLSVTLREKAPAAIRTGADRVGV